LRKITPHPTQIQQPRGKSHFIPANHGISRFLKLNEIPHINEGIHHLIMGRYLSVLVTEDDEVVGILRLSDVFSEVSGIIKECGLEQELVSF
jgi:hypothetical protein